jgi:hypothetical protein
MTSRVWAALGDARTVLNVGAGTGSYEPTGPDVSRRVFPVVATVTADGFARLSDEDAGRH